MQHALAYAELGWHVFTLSGSKKPLRNCARCDVDHLTPADKESCACLNCHAFYAATTDAARITEMVERNPRGTLGLRTGEVSGVAVVDVDIRNFVRGAPAPHDPGSVTMRGLYRQNLLPSTLRQSTGGGGLHFLYAHPGGYLMSGAGKYGPAVDSKADGSYIVVAPSATKAGRYEWIGDGRYDHPLAPLPEELEAMVRPSQPTTNVVLPLTPARRAEAGPGAARPRLRGVVHRLLQAPPGTRNDVLYWAATKVGEMIARGDVQQHVAVAALQRAAAEIGLRATEVGDEAHGSIASGLRKGMVSGAANVRQARQ